MLAGGAVAETFHPRKLNYSCYGNVEPHIHWHIFLRYDSDPDRFEVPWFHSADFDKFSIEETTAQKLGVQIRAKLLSKHFFED